MASGDRLFEILDAPSPVANKLGGQFAGKIEAIEQGETTLPWYAWFRLGGQADFFLFFVLVAVLAGTSFGPQGEGFVRLSYANSQANLKKAIERIAGAF